ncbi:MAG: TOBE domain-containing protein [Candidatus Korobacteraceae bacterium]|jgi:molybdate transport system regulatory protein
MKISARNTLAGSVTKVTKGAVNSEVDLTLKGGEKVVAIITNESVTHLGLKEGTHAYAIIKASWVILGKGLDAKKLSARNVLPGKVSKVHEGAVNNEVVLKLTGGSEVTAIITRESSHSLGFKEGDEAFAVVKASSVIIAVD